MSQVIVPRGLLFDLDGTLVDTAPDLAAATNRLREHHGLAPLPFALIRAQVSNGASALVKLALDLEAEHPAHAEERQKLLDYYAENVADLSCLFPGLEALLTAWQNAERPWGIVTNKPRRYAEPLIAALGLQPGVMLCADDLPVKKPDPEPLLEAARRLGVAPSECWYIGDHYRDMEAGARAGMVPVAVRYGYIPQADDTGRWPAQQWFETSQALASALMPDS